MHWARPYGAMRGTQVAGATDGVIALDLGLLGLLQLLGDLLAAGAMAQLRF